MSSDNAPIIIIKKIKKGKKEHHGGSWKIAYADFVTAMMAFFMLLWLLSLLNKYQLQGVSAYFQKPLSDIFVGSKNEEHYKTPTKEKKSVHNKGSSGSADLDVPVEKLQDAVVKTNVKVKAGVDTKDMGKKTDDSMGKSKDDASNKGGQNTTMEQIKRKLEISLQNNAALKQFKDNLSFEIVDDGVKVSLHDSKNNPMFSLGKANFQNYAKNIVTWLSGEFNHIPKKIVITGHTDAYQYDEKAAYTNWELSTDRANAVRRLLIHNGMAPAKIIRVEGAADVSLQDKKNGDSAINRRVEIIILTDDAANRIKNQ